VYTDFYHLKEKPFELTPSSRFLYLGESHKKALDHLTYGVSERKGLILLTGEIGTGKTTMVHALLNNIDKNTQYIHLSNPLLSLGEFMDYLAFSAFKKKVHFKSKTDFLFGFEEFLRQCMQQQKNFILIIDEAQNLSFRLLEEVRLLSNMDFADEKLINIFLVGQPELNEKLNNPRCKPLLQRISSRYHIPPLDFNGTIDYMATRLQIAGRENGIDIFSKSALRAIHHYSKGYPRVINVLADNSLLLGYSKGKKKITTTVIKQCYEDMSLGGSRKKSEPSDIKKIQHVYSSRYWKWAAALFCIMVIVAAGMSQIGQDIVGRLSGLLPVSRQVPVGRDPIEQVQEKKGKNQKIMDLSSKNRVKQQLPPDVHTEEKEIKLVNLMQSEGSKEKRAIIRERDEDFFKSVIAQPGDTVIQLAASVYSRTDEEVLNLIQKYNPEIKDINWIDVGQEIIFPPLSLLHQGPAFTVHIASFGPFRYARDMFQKLLKEGHEAYIIPVHNTQKGKFFRVTLGNFKNREEAERFAAVILKNGISDYAEAIQVEMK
jgi:type II secretory pathway predicted ATPase ExeA